MLFIIIKHYVITLATSRSFVIDGAPCGGGRRGKGGERVSGGRKSVRGGKLGGREGC